MPRSQDRVLRELKEVVDPSHTALIVVDVQNDFVSSDGFIAKFGLDVSDMQAAIPRINDFIRLSRATGVPVIYLREVIAESTVLPNFLALFGAFENIAVREGTWGAELYDQLLPPEDGDRVVVKPCYDGFEDTNLDVTLRSLGIRTCIYAGFASNVCVEATARHGFVKGYYSVLLSDATGAATPEEHMACERVFKVFYGPVVRTEEIAAAWESAKAAAPELAATSAS
jgi:ureidoacrylate peracid hydrolase